MSRRSRSCCTTPCGPTCSGPDPEATEDELWQALASASADVFVSALPDGLDTLVGDRGVLVSGGERQRLSLARALLRRPSLLILDEATSSLDSENEARIQQAIDQLHRQVTIVIITHRLSTIRDADVIHVVDGGQLVESGSWNELIALRSGRFRALCRAQGIDDHSVSASGIRRHGRVAGSTPCGSQSMNTTPLSFAHDRLVVSDRVVARPVSEATVLLNLDTGRSFMLDDVGARAWSVLMSSRVHSGRVRFVVDRVPGRAGPAPSGSDRPHCRFGGAGTAGDSAWLTQHVFDRFAAKLASIQAIGVARSVAPVAGWRCWCLFFACRSE